MSAPPEAVALPASSITPEPEDSVSTSPFLNRRSLRPEEDDIPPLPLPAWDR